MMTTMRLSTLLHQQLFEEHHGKSHPILHHINVYGNPTSIIKDVHFITYQSHIVRRRNNPQNFVSHLGIHEFNPTKIVKLVHFRVLKHTKEIVERLPLFIFHHRMANFQDLKQGCKLDYLPL